MLRWFRKKEEAQPAQPRDTESRAGRLAMSRSRLVQVIGPEDPHCVCGDWVGAVLSSQGNTQGYPSMAEAAEDGLFHPGCRHNLAAFDPQRVSPQRLEEAHQRTQRAVSAMRARANQGRDILPVMAGESRRAPDEVCPDPLTRFERVYDAARRADLDGDFGLAWEKCRAGLDILESEKVYEDGQERIMLVLQARLKRIEEQMNG